MSQKSISSPLRPLCLCGEKLSFFFGLNHYRKNNGRRIPCGRCLYNLIGMEIIPGPEWQTLLAIIMKLKGAVMIVGATDSGKSTIARYLITQLVPEGIRVSLVDTDVGQTSLGLPGTISVKVFSSGKDLEAFAPEKMFFVGTVNPATRIPLIIRVTKTAVAGCREKSDVVLIDTSGLVSGKIGEALKIGKIRAINPEHIIGVQRGDEIEHILKLAGDIDISRVAASRMVKSRDTARRVRYRKKKYEDYLRDAQPLEYLVRMQEAELFYNGGTLSAGDGGLPKGNIIGLNHGEETLGLGVLTGTGDDWITFRSPLRSLKRINRIVFGDITFRQPPVL
jgi:polynucleotide 5'-hydroxyl-kinase GRC3/NOL9